MPHATVRIYFNKRLDSCPYFGTCFWLNLKLGNICCTLQCPPPHPLTVRRCLALLTVQLFQVVGFQLTPSRILLQRLEIGMLRNDHGLFRHYLY